MSFRGYVGRIKTRTRNKMLDVIQRARLNEYLRYIGDEDKGLVYVECPAEIKGIGALDVYSHDSEVCKGCGNYLICDDLIKRNELGEVKKVRTVMMPSTISEN